VPTALWRRVGNEVLLATPEASDIDRLSLPASAVWLLLDQPQSREVIERALAEEFEVSSQEISEHVTRLIQELEDRRWLVRGTFDA
jgi:hypothetical protein